MKLLFSLRTLRLARLLQSGVGWEDFRLMDNSFSGVPQSFECIRETNPDFERSFLSLTPTLPALVFKKRFLFAGASMDDFDRIHPLWR